MDDGKHYYKLLFEIHSENEDVAKDDQNRIEIIVVYDRYQKDSILSGILVSNIDILSQPIPEELRRYVKALKDFSHN